MLHVLLCLFLCSNVIGQCSDSIPMPEVEKRQIFSELPGGYEIDTLFEGTNVMVLHKYERGITPWMLGVKQDSTYIIWRIDSEHTYNPSKFEMKMMKVDGIEDSLIYFEWQDYDVGAGSGSITHSKSFWTKDGSKCYARFVDKCSHVFKDKYGPNATYKVYITKFYCKATFSRFGIRITTNNTCDLNVEFPGSSIEVSEFMVGKIKTGFYYFESDHWKLRQ